MNVELIQARLIQAQQICTYINMKVAKGDFRAALNMAQKLLPILTQINMPDLVEEATKLIELLKNGDTNVTKSVAEFSVKVNAKLSEETPHLHLAKEIKCPHCQANIVNYYGFRFALNP